MTKLVAAAALAACLLTAAGAAAQSDDRAEYYYPPITSEEVFDRSLAGAPPASRDVRITFTTQITKAQLAAPESPRFVIFAKGDDAQHMIIVALDDQIFRTVFRARAVLAQLTANARGTEFFVRSGISTSATWFDLAKLLGFADLIITDGATWTHRVQFK